MWHHVAWQKFTEVQRNIYVHLQWISTRLHAGTSQNTVTFIFAIMRTSNFPLWRRLKDVSCEVFTVVTKTSVYLGCHIVSHGNHIWHFEGITFFFRNIGIPRLEDVSTCLNFFHELDLLQMFYNCSVSTNHFLNCFKTGRGHWVSSFLFMHHPLNLNLQSVKLLNNLELFVLDRALSPLDRYGVLYDFVLVSSCHTDSEIVIHVGDYWMMWKLRLRQTIIERMILWQAYKCHGTYHRTK